MVTRGHLLVAFIRVNPADEFRLSSGRIPPTLMLTAWRQASAPVVSVWWPPSI